MTLLKVEQVATKLAISKHFIRKLIKDGHISPVRIGRSVRVRAADIEKIIDSGGIETLRGGDENG